MRGFGFAGRHPEGFVHSAVEFVVEGLRVGLELGALLSEALAGFEFVLMFVEDQEGFADAGQGIGDAEVVVGVLFEGSGVDINELLVQPGHGDVQADNGEERGMVFGGQFKEAFTGVAEVIAAFTVFEVELVTAVEPVGDILDI